MTRAYLIGGALIALLLIMMVLAFILLKVRYLRRRKALRQFAENYYRSRRALVLYVMLNHQCSEEEAYQRLATFAKKHVPLDDQSYIDWMLRHDRESLIDSVRNILARDPNAIDKI
jgi:flagellar biosynthesis/type III secretory pathway M-ring protein FliF/YscJ